MSRLSDGTSLLLQDTDDASDAPAAANSTAEGEGNITPRSAPLLPKTAGIREAGLVFAPAKGWWAGLLLVVISGLVLGVTLFTTLMD